MSGTAGRIRGPVEGIADGQARTSVREGAEAAKAVDGRDVPTETHPEPHGELLVRTAAGDAVAFQRFYCETNDLIRRYVASRVDIDDVEDLVADVYVKAYRGAGRFRPQGRPAAAWLVTIARNTVATHHRSRSRRRLGPTGDDRLERGVEEQLVERDDEAALLMALAELSPIHQRVLTLRFFDECSVAECASRMAMTDQAVRAMTYRALQSLRRVLGDRPDDILGRGEDDGA